MAVVRALVLCVVLSLLWTPQARGQVPNAGTLPAPSEFAQRMQTAGTASAGRRVLALYYPWYRTLQYSHTWAHQEGVEPANKRMVSHTRYPAQGPYDSADPAVIDRHFDQAEAAGIDTLVCSWWGPNDPTDHALRLLLMRAAKRSLKICVLWEQPNTPGAVLQTPEKTLMYLLETFSRQPAYLKVNNKPVIFAFENVCRAFSPSAWAATLNDLNRRFAPGVLLMGTGQTQTDLLLWDGGYELSGMAQMAGQTPDVCARLLRQQMETPLLLSKRLNRITVVSLAPGYDDRKANATSGSPVRTFVDRQDGRLYSALWQQAIAADPEWILINSFNQWHAGTEIEPSVELGDTYLKLTRQYAVQFKQKRSAK